MTVMAPVSWGELIDKITILEIKSRKLGDPAKLANVLKEFMLLSDVRDREFAGNAALTELTRRLSAVNERLWQIEDDIRECERRRDFGDRFVDLARAVYVTNDERAALKRRINELLGSALVEEKSYAAYS
jgi:hypothetical protein